MKFLLLLLLALSYSCSEKKVVSQDESVKRAISVVQLENIAWPSSIPLPTREEISKSIMRTIISSPYYNLSMGDFKKKDLSGTPLQTLNIKVKKGKTYSFELRRYRSSDGILLRKTTESKVSPKNVIRTVEYLTHKVLQDYEESEDIPLN